MGFVRPEWLWLALLVPACAFGYALLPRRRPALAPRLAVERAPAWQRHLAPLGLLVAALLLLVAAAGPTAPLTLPTDRRTVILAMDVSGSMEGRDIAPTRLGAAQAAARSLVAELPRGVRVGVVAYADNAHLVQAPTAHHDAAIAAIDRLKVEGGTAIGDGILCSLAAIFPDGDGARASLRSEAHRPGWYRSAAIVLLTDGQNSFGADPMEAARQVALRGVKIYTIGFGTAAGSMIGPENSQVLVRLDEDALRQIAEATGAEYFRAASGVELRRVYQGLQSRLEMNRDEIEVSALVALAGAVLVVFASGLSLAWFGRIA
jgi:Ca-activated chloride channel family protein